MSTTNALNRVEPMHQSPLAKVLLLLAAIVLLSASANEAFAQKHSPFIDLGYETFDSDLQFFAPAEVDTYGGAPDPNTGWFFTYDRVYMNVTRPRDVIDHWQGDFTWGNRYDIGYMTDDGHGWLFSALHVDGPNLPGVNEADYSSVEFNKVWRLDQLHNSGYLEPFIGIRYTKFIDFLDQDFPVENNMIGGQIGMRWFKQKGRWLLSAEGRLAPQANFQFFEQEDRNEFALQGEVRVDATYEVTRDVGVRFGYQLNHFGQGVARGIDFNNNSEDLTMNGVTFGINWKR